MPDIAALVTPPLLLDSTGAPANGDIYVRVTSSIAIDGAIVTPTQGHGKVVAGQFRALDGSAFHLPVTPEGDGVEIVVELIEDGPGRGRPRHVIRRTVAVPDAATVTWDDLVDVVPIESGSDYVIPPWVAAVLDAKAVTEDAAAAAEESKVAAEAAAATVPSASSISASIASSTPKGFYNTIRKLKRGTGTITILIYGDSTSRTPTAWTRQLAGRLNTLYPAWTARTRQWDDVSAFGAPTTNATGTGSGVLDVYIMGQSSRKSEWGMGAFYTAGIAAVPTPDIFINMMGKNDFFTSLDEFMPSHAAVTERVAATFPSAEIGIFVPTPNGTVISTDSMLNASNELVGYATERGYEVLNGFDVWANYPGDISTLTDVGDTIHPNAVGNAALLDMIAPHFVMGANAIPLPRQKSLFLDAGERLLAGSLFPVDFDGASLPAGWILSGLGEIADNTVDRLTGAKCLAVTRTSGTVYLERAFTADELNQMKGRWYTVSARMLNPTGGDIGNGRLGWIVSGTSVGGSNITFINRTTDEGLGGWRTSARRLFVPLDATAVKVRIYIGGTLALLLNDIDVSRGKLPRGYPFVSSPPAAILAAPVVTAFTAPTSTSLAATATLPSGATQLRLRWIKQGAANWNYVADQASTTWSITSGVLASTKYTTQVAAIYPSGVSAYSPLISVTTPA